MPIKVLHVTFDMTIGGTQQVIRQLVENMDQAEIHSEIVCIDGKLGELGEVLQEQGIPFHILKRQLGFDIGLIQSLYHLIKANQYDVIHCHQYTPYVYGVIAAVLTKAKVIFTEHGRFHPDYGTRKRQLINPIFNLLTAKITAISQATKQALVKFEGFNADKIEVIYNGIADESDIAVDETALKKSLKIPQSAFIFGTISRLQPIKNQPMMIKAFKQVYDQNKDTHLLIVGDGEIRSDLENLVHELGLKNSVTFTGFQKAPYRFHSIIDVFLLTSFSEGTSMTLLEAMSFSKPSIVSTVGGNPELIKDGLNGYLIKVNDLDGLVKKMTQLIYGGAVYNAMASEARLIYLKRFSYGPMVKKYLKIYYESNI